MRTFRAARRQLVGLFVLAMIAAIGLSACGSSKPSSTTTSTSAPVATHPKSTAKHYPNCSASLLSYSPTFGGAAAGGSYYRVKVTSSSPSECQLEGYPQVTFYAPNAAGGAASGSLVSITVHDGGSAPKPVALAHGQSAEFLLLYTDVPVNGGGCVSVASMNVKPSSEAYATPLPITFAPCGGSVTVYAFAPSGTENP